MGGLFAAVGDVSWLSHGQIEDALYRVAQGRGVLRMERGADYFIGVQHRHGEAAVGECSPDVVAAVHGVIEDPDAGALHAGYRGEQAFPAIDKWRANPGGFLADAALIIWDKRARRLEAIRGWSTHRPLFWTEHRGAILLASEIRVLLQLCGRAWIPDPIVEDAFLAGQAQPVDASGCIGIGLVSGGASLDFDFRHQGAIASPGPRTLGLPDTGPSRGNRLASPGPDLIAEALVALDREIALQGRPLYHLSSGADSSTLVLAALESRCSSGTVERLSCYTRGFPGTASDESERVAEFCSGRRIEWLLERQDQARIDQAWAACADRLDFLVGPTIYGALSSALRASSEGHPVVVSGIGGDEVFGAYEHLCGGAALRDRLESRKVLAAWLGHRGILGEARALLDVSLARWRYRSELLGTMERNQRNFHWRLRRCALARGKLAAEQIHEHLGVSMEAPFLRGMLLTHLARMGEMARLGQGSTKGLLDEVRRLLARPIELPDSEKVTLDHAIPTSLRPVTGPKMGPVFDRMAMLGAWRRSVMGGDHGR